MVGFMGTREELNALRKAAIAASETMSPPASREQVERAFAHRDLLISQAHAAGISANEIADATHLTPDQTYAAIAKPGL